MSRPFGKIALSLSGGATRAAGFHLGTLWYLDRLGLLEDVATVTSASGGSFVATTWAMSLKRGKTFTDYFSWMVDRLRKAEMVEWCLSELTDGTPKSRSGRRTLVTALAEVYDRHFFEGFRFGQFWDEEPGIHLEDFVFNATDFRTGLGFHFSRHGPIGNARTPIPAELVRQVRLADVMAASSCIPGGMEPFFFPHDFVWEGNDADEAFRRVEQILHGQGVDSTQLMDGGIYDNEGIESTLLAVDRMVRRAAGESEGIRPEPEDEEGLEAFPFEFGKWFHRLAQGAEDNPAHQEAEPGLFILSDTPLEADPVYRRAYQAGDTLPLRAVKPVPAGGMTLGQLRAGWWGLFAICLITVGVLIVHGVDAMREAGDWHIARDLDDVFAYLVPLLLAFGALGGLLWIRKAFRGAMAGLDQVLRTEGTTAALSHPERHAWPYLHRLTLRQAGDLLGLRTSSMLSLVSDIFMIRARSLSYALIYGTPRWRRRVLPNEIYALAALRWSGAKEHAPTEAMAEVSRKASHMPTAFWFEHPEDLDILIAAGQMTICHGLLEHIRRMRLHDPGSITPEIAALEARAEQDWARFRTDPMTWAKS